MDKEFKDIHIVQRHGRNEKEYGCHIRAVKDVCIESKGDFMQITYNDPEYNVIMSRWETKTVVLLIPCVSGLEIHID